MALIKLNRNSLRISIVAKLPYGATAGQYAEQVVAGDVPVCLWVKLACQRKYNYLARLRSKAAPVVKSEFVPCHIRMPAYIRGKTGIIVDISPEYPFPDAAAHGLPTKKQRTFDVCFRGTNLWIDEADEAEVHVGVFHAYLEKS